MRREAEQSSVAALEEAKSQIKSLLAEVSTAGSGDRNRVISQIQSIIYELQKVKSGTTAYTEAQELLRSAQQRLKEIQPLSLGN